MAKCVKCGKRGLFLSVNAQGLCADCEKSARLAAEAAAKEEKAITEPKKEISPEQVAELEALIAEDEDQDFVSVPESIAGIHVAYTYSDVKIYIPDDITVDFTQINPGDNVILLFEPENPYDAEAVAVYVEDEKIGYLNKGRIKDMVRDFKREKLPIWAHVSGIDDEEPLVMLYMAFYRNRG